MHFGFPASVLIIRMDNDLGKLTKSSHAYAESTVKPPFGGNDSDQLLSDDLFNSSFYPLCYISADPAANCTGCLGLAPITDTRLELMLGAYIESLFLR